MATLSTATCIKALLFRVNSLTCVECHVSRSILLNSPQRVLGYIEHGKREGARLVVGGERYDRPGFFVRPTIFTDVKPDMKIAREEIFGPVAVVVKFKSEEEAIGMANDTDYGLSSYVFTQDLNIAIRMANALEAGNTFVGV